MRLEEYQTLPLAKSPTVIDLERIAVHSHLQNRVSLHAVGGKAYRVEGKLEEKARRIHKLTLDGYEPMEMEPGKIGEIFQKILDDSGDAEIRNTSEDNKVPAQNQPSLDEGSKVERVGTLGVSKEPNPLAVIASKMADKLIDEFATHLEAELTHRLETRKAGIVNKVFWSLLG